MFVLHFSSARAWSRTTPCAQCFFLRALASSPSKRPHRPATGPPPPHRSPEASSERSRGLKPRLPKPSFYGTDLKFLDVSKLGLDPYQKMLNLDVTAAKTDVERTGQEKYVAEIRERGKLKQPKKLLQVFDDMESAGIEPDASTFLTALESLARLGKADRVLLLFERLKSRADVPLHQDHVRVLLKSLCRAGRADEALALFNESPIRSSELLDVVVTGYVVAGELDKALALVRSTAEEQGRVRAESLVAIMDEMIAELPNSPTLALPTSQEPTDSDSVADSQPELESASMPESELGSDLDGPAPESPDEVPSGGEMVDEGAVLRQPAQRLVPSVRVYNELIREFGKAKRIDGVFATVDHMRLVDRVEPDAETFEFLAQAVIRDLKFIKGATSTDQLVKDGRPEIAFLGLSNVGKSSLVNMVVGRRAIARTSKKPGKTREFNYFSVNDKFYLVDLPGLGYAAVSQEQRAKWGQLIESYLTEWQPVRFVFHLMDCRRDPSPHDLWIMSKVAQRSTQSKYVVVLTKCDKYASKTSRLRRAAVIRQHLEEHGIAASSVPIVLSSSDKKWGRDDIWLLLSELLL